MNNLLKINLPGSRCQWPPSLEAVAVKPALVEPIPVVLIPCGKILEAYFSNWDLPVPGSPTNNKWLSPK